MAKKMKRYAGDDSSVVMSEDEADTKQTAVEDLVDKYSDMGPKSHAVPETKQAAPAKKKPKPKFQNDESWREPVHTDAEAGMSRGSRSRFKIDEEARGASRMAAYKPRYTPSPNAPKFTQGKTYASGGSASSRADGIAQKGKTRGTIVMCGGGMYKK